MSNELDTLIAELRKKADAATPGPWYTYDNSFDAGVVTGLRAVEPGKYSTFNCGLEFDEMIVGGEPSEGRFNGPDAAFTAAARTMVPALLDALEAMRAQRNEFIGCLHWLNNHPSYGSVGLQPEEMSYDVEDAEIARILQGKP